MFYAIQRTQIVNGDSYRFSPMGHLFVFFRGALSALFLPNEWESIAPAELVTDEDDEEGEDEPKPTTVEKQPQEKKPQEKQPQEKKPQQPKAQKGGKQPQAQEPAGPYDDFGKSLICVRKVVNIVLNEIGVEDFIYQESSRSRKVVCM